MKLLLSNFRSHDDGGTPIEIEVAGNPLLTCNELRAGAAQVDGQGEGSGETVASYDTERDVWVYDGRDFTDVEVIG